MKIYTRKGDQGTTSIIGKKLSKHDARIHAIGAVDELSAYLGRIVAIHGIDELQDIQRDLY